MRPEHYELVTALKSAITYKEQHAKAQIEFFGDDKDAPLNHCGTSCCIAGDKVLRDLVSTYGVAEVERMLEEFVESPEGQEDVPGEALDMLNTPYYYALKSYNLDPTMAKLVFSPYAHYKIHEFVISAIENSMCLKSVIAQDIVLRGTYVNEGVGYTLKRINYDLTTFLQKLKALLTPMD